MLADEGRGDGGWGCGEDEVNEGGSDGSAVEMTMVDEAVEVEARRRRVGAIAVMEISLQSQEFSSKFSFIKCPPFFTELFTSI